MAAKTEDEANRIVESLLGKAEFLRQEASLRGDRFRARSKEQLLSKIMGQTSNSPFFFSDSWNDSSPGGSTIYSVNVYNPDPFDYPGFMLFGHLFFWPGTSSAVRILH